jgi:hypothetical protein
MAASLDDVGAFPEPTDVDQGGFGSGYGAACLLKRCLANSGQMDLVHASTDWVEAAEADR